jgi:hypothetical protein
MMAIPFSYAYLLSILVYDESCKNIYCPSWLINFISALGPLDLQKECKDSIKFLNTLTIYISKK